MKKLLILLGSVFILGGLTACGEREKKPVAEPVKVEQTKGTDAEVGKSDTKEVDKKEADKKEATKKE
jgi:hypothetical protein